MKIVFSYIQTSFNPAFNIKLAKLSNFLAQKHGYITELYVDDANYKNFQKIPYNNIIKINSEELKFLPLNIWSSGKLLVFSKMREPFLHIDFDLLLVNDYLRFFWEKDLVFFHEEPWFSTHNCRLKIHPILDDSINWVNTFYNFNLDKDNIKSFNCAVFGGKKFREINQYSNIVIEYLRNNQQKIQHYTKNNKTQGAIFFEQILFANMCREKLVTSIILNKNLEELDHTFFPKLFEKTIKIKSLRSIYSEMYHNKIIHLWGRKKSFLKNLILKDF
jgi:hypothetical protein